MFAFDVQLLQQPFPKIHVVATPLPNWSVDRRKGDVVNMITLEVGYLDKDGVIQYKNSGRYYDNPGKQFSDDFKPAILTKDNKNNVFVFDFAVDDRVPSEKRFRISIYQKVIFEDLRKEPDCRTFTLGINNNNI